FFAGERLADAEEIGGPEITTPQVDERPCDEEPRLRREFLRIERRDESPGHASWEERAEELRIGRVDAAEHVARVERRKERCELAFSRGLRRCRERGQHDFVERVHAAPTPEPRKKGASFVDSSVRERADLGEETQPHECRITAALFAWFERFVERAVVNVGELFVRADLLGKRDAANDLDEAKIGVASGDGGDRPRVPRQTRALQGKLVDGERLRNDPGTELLFL